MTKNPMAEPNPSARQKTILIIDDEIDLVLTLKELLEGEGYRIVTAHNGEEGLQKLTHIHPDLIMLDMNMPKMSGLQFYKRITKFDEKGHSKCPYPVLILTARAELQELFLDLHVDGFMNKPFQLNALLDTLEDIFSRQKSQNSKLNIAFKQKAIKVLLVEHDDEGFKAAITEFAAAGFIVTGARNTRIALERIADQKPDIIFARYALPEIKGDVLAMQLKRQIHSKEIPIVLYDDAEILTQDKIETLQIDLGLAGLIFSRDPKKLIEYIAKVVPIV